MDQDNGSESNQPPLRKEVIEALKKHGDKQACMGALSLAGMQNNAIHVLHLTRNQLDKNKEGYQNRCMFLNGAIKIMETEMERSLQFMRENWQE